MPSCRVRLARLVTRASSFVILMPLLSCAAVAFKRGSGPDDFAAASHVCHAADSRPAAMHDCLVRGGWNVTGLGSDEPSPMATGTGTARPPAAATSAEPPVGQTRAYAAFAMPTPQPPYQNPDDKISVGAWLKFGAGPADLHETAEMCIATLGAAHRAANGYHSVTRALYSCLGQHGWRGIGHSLS